MRVRRGTGWVEVRFLVFMVLGACCATVPARAVTMDWTLIGSPGNAGDPTVQEDGTSGYGAVDYAYRIGTYDVTNAQYIEFLNAKDPTGKSPLQIYLPLMSDPVYGGVTYDPAAPEGAKYTAIAGRENWPVNYVTWYDAIRFANWMNNGQGNADTESGSYTILGNSFIPSNGLSITRNTGPDVKIVLQSEDEWYKAAYYDPRTTAEGGPPDDSHYWFYTFGTNDEPIPNVPNDLPNTANFENMVGTPSDVGAYTNAVSPWGLYDIGGNVFQWNEAIVLDTYRGGRGGAFDYHSHSMEASDRPYGTPSSANARIGFRLVTLVVPEPSTWAMAIGACLGLAGRWGLCRVRRK